MTTSVTDGSPGTVEVLSSLAPVVDRVRAGALAAVGLDMPIGLPADGYRAADREARVLLGPRRSSLFPTPPACVLDAADYADALVRCRAVAGKGLSKQAFNLVPKMRQIADLVTSDLQPAISEVHPETSFAVLAGRPCTRSKRTQSGVAERLELLQPHFDSIAEALTHRPPGAAVDDVLDGFAAAWTARRLARREALVLGDDTARDARGFRLTISA